jgi:hypothetical protein
MYMYMSIYIEGVEHIVDQPLYSCCCWLMKLISSFPRSFSSSVPLSLHRLLNKIRPQVRAGSNKNTISVGQGGGWMFAGGEICGHPRYLATLFSFYRQSAPHLQATACLHHQDLEISQPGHNLPSSLPPTFTVSPVSALHSSMHVYSTYIGPLSMLNMCFILCLFVHASPMLPFLCLSTPINVSFSYIIYTLSLFSSSDTVYS